ncbi:MAG: M48 family metalloprotease, partial [Pseudomonadota bacterium]
LLDVAGLRSGDVRLILVQDRTLNAFVARGQNIFLHTGLLTETETAGEIAGVLAHEIGHISGGHLARLPEALDNLAIQNFIALILGAAAGALSGDAGVGAGVMTGAQSSALRSTLAYTRQQESSADAAALTFLDRVGWSAAGFSRFMSKLGDQELLYSANQDPYFRTHPLTRGRVSAINGHVSGRGARFAEPPREFEAAMARVRAKIIGFLDGRIAVGRRYPSSDNSDAALFARAVAAYRTSDLGVARTLTEQLIGRSPRDPYYREFLGDVQLSAGDARTAAQNYREAVGLAPDQPLLRFAQGRALLQIGDQASFEQAVAAFRAGLRSEPDNPRAWRDLSIALGRSGEVGRADLAFAESAFLVGDFAAARERGERARQRIPAGDPARLRAADLVQAAELELANRR